MSDGSAIQGVSKTRIYGSMTILILVIAIANVDRFAFSIILDPLKKEFGMSDTMAGFLTGSAFALFYATFGIPVARIADTVNRRKVIAVAVGLWSIATALCGVAQTQLQLFIFRMSVGIGEAGATPPSHSLIANYFPPEKRALPMASLYVGAMMGSSLVFFVGGWLAQQYGWRIMLLAVGLPGVIISVLAWVFLVEKRPATPLPSFGAMASETWAVGKILFGNPAYVHLMIGYTFFGFVSFGVTHWDTAYFARSFSMSIPEVTKAIGASTLIAGLIGVVSGGFIGQLLAKRGLKWFAIFPACCMLLCTPFFLGKYMISDFKLAVLSMIIGSTILIAFVGPFFAAVQAVVTDRERSTAVALVVFFANILGYGLGPVIVGFLSDLFAAEHGVMSLRYALPIATLVMPWAAAHIYYASRLFKV